MTASEKKYDLLKRQNEEIKVNKTKYHLGVYLLISLIQILFITTNLVILITNLALVLLCAINIWNNPISATFFH